MNKITITDGNVMYNFLIDRCKYLLGNNSIEKHKIKQLIKLYFNPVKSEYRTENNLKPKILIDGKELNNKSTFYIEISDKYSLNEECKLGSKSILLKYFERKLEDYSYFDTINTIDILFQSLIEELNEEDSFKLEFDSLSSKILLKILKPYFALEEQMDEYDLSLEDLIIQQIRIIKYIQEKDHTIEKYFIYVDSKIISKQIINELNSLKNSIILINDTIWKEQYELKDIVLVEDTILDCADFDLMYGYFGENNGELLTLKEVNNKIMKYIKHFYKGNKIDLINDINKHSL